MRSAHAKVLGTDKDLDLALLKIAATQPLPVVRLDRAAPLEIGEAVCLIGHPGLGREILDYTMTHGIISNGSRIIDKLPYIQTNATVNPGCSGSPLFNSHGNVIGLVVLKARIESTGFAVPASRLVQFLRSFARESAAPKPKAPSARPERRPATGPSQLALHGRTFQEDRDEGQSTRLPREDRQGVSGHHVRRTGQGHDAGPLTARPTRSAPHLPSASTQSP